MTPSLQELEDARAILIAGPTASGKSVLALRLADAAAARGRGAVIVNADSMQVYAALRVLTARPGEADTARLPHHLYGYVPAEVRHSVGSWVRDIEPVLAELLDSALLPIVVGGTGLYFKALTEGLAATPPVPSDVRVHWSAELAAHGAAALHAALEARDPASAAKIRPSDPQRTLRALEVLDATGTPLLDWQKRAAPPLVAADGAIRVVIEPERRELHRRIEQRVDAMVGAGAIEEVAALLALGLHPSLPVMKAIGVREFGAHLRNDTGLAGAVTQTKTATRRYAKRQATWFRNQMPDWQRLRLVA